VSCAKTAKPIEMSFGLWTWVYPRNHALDGIQIPTRVGVILRARRPARTRRTVDILTATQRGQHLYGADADWSVLDGVHIGATLQMRLNRPCAVCSVAGKVTVGLAMHRPRVTGSIAMRPSTPFTRYNRLSNRLYKRFDNRLYRVNKHPTGCQTGLTTGLTTVLNEQPLFLQPC